MKNVFLFYFLLLSFLFSNQLTAQQETEITSEGVFIPRIDHTTIGTADIGQLVYDTNTNSFWFYDGSSWDELNTGVADEASDADGDTKIQLEESADEDMIRFDIGGTERFVMKETRLEVLNTGNSIFIGIGAGSNDDLTSNYNTFVGTDSGHNNTTGYWNSAYGSFSLYTNTEGHFNSAYGTDALLSNNTGDSNSAFGYNCLGGNNSGMNNSALGFASLTGNNSGSNNSAVGKSALISNVTGSDNTAIGFEADVSAGDLTNATAIGANTIVAQSNALILGNNANVGIGTSTPDAKLHVAGDLKIVDGNESAGKTLISDADGLASWSYPVMSSDADNDTKIQVEESTDEDMIRFDLGGTEYFVMDGPRLKVLNSGESVFIGEGAGANTSLNNNYRNTFIGYNSGNLNTMGSFNAAFGFNPLLDNTTGSFNCAFGSSALRDNTTADNNSAFGASTLVFNTTGSDNSAFGHQALRNNTTADNNSAFGADALDANTTGISNSAFGKDALTGNTTANYNSAFGRSALFNNTTGSSNSAYGVDALVDNVSGNSNSAFGRNALGNNTGFDNTAVGRNSLVTNTSGGDNTAIGYAANVSTGTLNNATVIGANAEVDASNKVRIGNSSVSSNGGQVTWTAYSDARIKNNIQENIPGLNFINRLRPVSYHFDVDKQNNLTGIEDTSDYPEKYDIENIAFSGFLAQEVDQAAQSIGYDFSAVDKSGKLLGLRYAEFVVPLVKAVQELDKENASLKKENQALKEESLVLKNQIYNIMARLDALENGE